MKKKVPFQNYQSQEQQQQQKLSSPLPAPFFPCRHLISKIWRRIMNASTDLHSFALAKYKTDTVGKTQAENQRIAMYTFV